MAITYHQVSDFERGTLFRLLKDAYSFNFQYERYYCADWQMFDDFFYDRFDIADNYGLITVLDDVAIGFISWDPRNLPEYAIIGYNCIVPKYQRNGYGTQQLKEAVDRIYRHPVKKIIVTTNSDLIPAQRMYERAGFTLRQKRENHQDADFFSEYYDYEYSL